MTVSPLSSSFDYKKQSHSVNNTGFSKWKWSRRWQYILYLRNSAWFVSVRFGLNYSRGNLTGKMKSNFLTIPMSVLMVYTTYLYFTPAEKWNMTHVNQRAEDDLHHEKYTNGMINYLGNYSGSSNSPSLWKVKRERIILKMPYAKLQTSYNVSRLSAGMHKIQRQSSLILIFQENKDLKESRCLVFVQMLYMK